MTPGLPQDFGDWINPILVKELRQGLRTRVFTAAFIALQTILLLFMLAGLREGANDEFLTGSFWFLLFFILVIITPLRGLQALSSEVRQNTLDLLSLTRLDALRICFGKWAALFAQALLFAMAALPYVVLRYFLGGVDLPLELAFLGLGLALSALLCAVSLALSSLANNLARTVLITGFALALFSSAGPVWISSTLPSGSSLSFSSGWNWAGFLLLSASLTFFCISAAATRIAPAAENHSTLRRLLGLAGIAASLALAFARDEEFLALAYAFLTLLAVDALTEHSNSLPSVHHPFLRLGPAGRPLQFLLTPGWHSGMLLVILLLAVLTPAFAALVSSSREPWRILTVHLSLAGILLLPVLVTQLVLQDPRDRFTPYFFIQAAHLALGGFFLMLGNGAKSEALLWLGSPLPSTSLFLALSRDQVKAAELFPLAALSFLAIAGALFVLGRRHFGAISALRKVPHPSEL